ncbi:methylenetetrahydrofolate reductase [Subtercola sp. YIM 133946]|uniref:methylenetetrahydrofolate reductase n=1 Tax=Subtercola sp. YIM 133946 TaxID=3118909 RepID=UPI002F93003D
MAHITEQPTAAARELVTDYSIEMTGKDLGQLDEAAARIPPGTRVNVTFLGTEDLPMRLTAARAVISHGFIPVPHISARRLRSLAELEEFVTQLEAAGASEHVFAVGGDPTSPDGPFDDSLGVIATGRLAPHSVREVAIAGYPEGHPAISSDRLWGALEDKTALLAEQGLECVILTQFAFDSAPVVDWIDEVRSRGILAPIRIGTPGPAGVKRLLTFARRFGIGANAMIVKKYGFSLTNLMGTAGPDRFVSDLATALAERPQSGDVRLHFYAFGGLAATAAWAADYVSEKAR